MRETGERLLPDGQHGKILHAEHLARYRFAAPLARDRRVLDAASGEGYGTAVLAAAGARSTAGVDLDADAVSHARAKYELDYRQADIAALPFPDRSFDLVVSFETIEHVADADRALAEFRRVLDEDGLLLISSPNATEYRVGNPFHVHEYTTEEFAELLRGHFPEVRLLYQQSWLLSSVLDEAQLRLSDGERDHDLEVTKVAGRSPGEEIYTVALCGSHPPPPPPAVGVVAGIFELYELLGQVELLTKETESLRRQVAGSARTDESLRRELEDAARASEGLRRRLEKRVAESDRKASKARKRLKAERRRRRATDRELERLKRSPGHRMLAALPALVRRRRRS